MSALNSLKKLSNAQLVALARQQLPYATTAWEELMYRHEKPLFSLCRNLCGNNSDAEDAYQEVLLRVFHHLPKFRGDSSFKTWVYRIAYNESITLIRQRKVHDSLDGLREPATRDSGKVGLSGDVTLHGLLDRLDLEDRSILALRLISDMDFQEIANLTGSGLSAVKMRYKRALEKLKPYIE